MFQKITLSILVCIAIFSNASAQPGSGKYDKAWSRIDSLLSKRGLIETAVAEVNKLYTMAKAEKQDAQIIKALVYRMSMRSMKEENASTTNIREIEKEIIAAAEPAKSILTSILAEMYWQHFNRNRYKLYDRTETVNFVKADINTWSLNDYHHKIGQLYITSISNEKLLQQIKFDRYKPIIIAGNQRQLRPTLFDLLAHRALQYFQNDERDIDEPTYAFQLDQASIFDPAADFIIRKYPTRDSLSLYQKALSLYQRLIRFHLNDANPDALIDVDLNRLQFVREHAVMENREELYLMSINHIAEQYGNHRAATQAWFLVAQWHFSKASEDTSYAGFVKSKEILDRLVSQKDSSEGRSNARLLLHQLTEPSARIIGEKVNVPGRPFRVLVTYKNTKSLFVRFIAITPRMKDSLMRNNDYNKVWSYLTAQKSIRSLTQQLPPTNDYREHRVEIKSDSLPIGEYIMLTSLNSGFSTTENSLSFQRFHVSNIGYLNRANQYFVGNRETGAPLTRASVQLWYRQYDYPTQRFSSRKGENIMTDKNGFFVIPASTSQANNSVRLELTHGNDRLFLDDEIYTGNNRRPIVTAALQTYFFTDRSIYRPGQVVYFKGIVIQTEGEAKSVATGRSVVVTLYDANGEKTDSIKLVTSSYGSYSGKFTLPQGTLNGSFRIEDGLTKHSSYISVEEYKRPRFSVEITKPGGTYRVNDTINVTGMAKAYAGNNIDGAIVKYRVVRRTHWRIWTGGYGRKIWPPHNSDEMEIAHGETKTNVAGEFTIPFTAIPNLQRDKSEQPVFYYEVSADITDINGETRSSSTTVAVAYQALKLSINIDGSMPADSLRSLPIRSTNLNDVFEKTTVKVSVYPLKQPTRLFRERYWEAPDQFVMTEQEYHQLFPLDIYKNENDFSTWERGAKVFEQIGVTNASDSFLLEQKLKPGWYSI
ncbi:MAG: alpha-2-macroglobulin, partial [Chitinophagaceae bacterium]|nr:alpha-2-macroglobulin [Chitinophagaceae bacterium]